jgi:hypothetical protein
MLKRLKTALVTSFVGAIALGWLFAQGILHFAYIFSAPVVAWLVRREYRGMIEHADAVRGFSFQDALPDLAKSFFLLLAGYLLLRWLYFTPLGPDSVEPNTTIDPTAEQDGRSNR